MSYHFLRRLLLVPLLHMLEDLTMLRKDHIGTIFSSKIQDTVIAYQSP